MGWYPSIATAGETMVGAAQRIAPDPRAAKRYEALYDSQYRPLYGKLKSLFERQLIAK
jgi:sugar (pentulose or hexulose) kinase